MQNTNSKPFLYQIAAQLIEQNTSFENIQVILPSRRSIVFMRSAFLELSDVVGWLPQFYSLEDFIQELGNFQKLDQIDLMFELYEVHREIEGDKAEIFEDFLSWGSLLLQDMNEIDRYLVDAHAIFDFLNEAKAIETWNPETGQLSDFQNKYLQFYRKLTDYYRLFRKRLIDKNQIYQGLGFRMVAEKLQRKEIDTKHIGQIYFVGFNALTKAEEQIMDFFIKEKNAIQLWDADEYYLNDPLQEAGMFLRQHQKKNEKPFEKISNDLLQSEKNISIYGVAGNVGQAKLIGSLVAQNQEQNAIQTALVLADETLLLPVLQSIPQKIERINVTMGYPLSASPFYSWFENYLLIFRQAALSSETETLSRYQLGNLLAFFEHQNSQLLENQCTKAIKLCVQALKEQQLFKIGSKQLEGVNNIFDKALFPEKKPSTLDLVEGVLALIKRVETNKIDALNAAFLAHFSSVFRRLEQLVKRESFELKIEGLIQLYRQLVSKENVNFIGEPLGGLQIMGVLESRTLDFDNIIISSVNEGILPSGKSVNSLIPFDIKKKFKLPSYKEKDAIFAYHFYRLLQRAKNISIIYNTKIDPFQGGEKSRFIAQLLHEIQEKNKNIQIEEKQVSINIPTQNEVVEEIWKKDFELKSIHNHLENGLSPSAINTYLNCPLDYYYNYVLKLSETETFQQGIEDHVLGTIVHDSLEILYQPFIGKMLDEKMLGQAKQLIPKTVETQFIQETKNQAEFGIRKLSYEVACKMLASLIDLDLNIIRNGNKLEIITLEESIEAEIELETIFKFDYPIKLKGKIDRIDRLNGQKRIIDYKTGSVSYTDLSFSKIDTLLNGSKGKALQLLIYQYIYSQVHPSEPIKAGNISLRNISNGFIELKTSAEEGKQNLKIVLENILNDLLDPDLAFSHKSNSNFCGFCMDRKSMDFS